MHVITFTPTELDVYRRRLCRSQVYCFVAVIGGFHLFLQCRDLPHDLLYGFSEEHQVLFSMAVGHWLVSLWEDLNSGTFLQSGLQPGDAPGVSSTGGYLESAYLWHHFIAALGYLIMLCTQACSAVGSFGLIFELPVLLLNHREFMAFADKPPAWFCKPESVQWYWNIVHVVFALARGGPAVVYVYSLCVWQSDLAELDILQTVMYHTMAVFFTLLNFNYQSQFLTAWSKRDRENALQGLSGNLAAAFTVEFGKKKEPPRPIDQDVIQLLQVPQEMVREKNGAPGKNGEPEFWIEIDRIAYNVTSFMKEHPGGESVLRKYAGQDASEAFKRVRHSLKAKYRMHQLAIGPIHKSCREYRIFEHIDLIIFTFWELISTSFVYGGNSVLIGNSGYVRTQENETIAALILPGMLLSTLAAGVVLLVMCFMDDSWMDTPPLKAHVTAWHVILHNVGLVLVRRPLPGSFPEACPTGLEVTAVCIFLLQDFLEGSIPMSPAVLLAAGGVLTSWSMRDAEMLLGLGSISDASHRGNAGASHLIGALLLAHSISWITCQTRQGLSKKEVATRLLQGFALSGVYSAAFMYALTSLSPTAAVTLGTYWSDTGENVLGLLLTAGIAAFSLVMLMNDSHVMSPPWAARLAAGCFAIGIIFAGGFRNYRWLVIIAFFSELGAMGARNRAQLRAAKSVGFQSAQVEMAKVGTQALWDQTRTFFLTLTWKLLISPMKLFINRLLPEELCVYACEIPIFELGSDVDLGVAAMYSPDHRASRHHTAGNGNTTTSQDENPEDEEAGKQRKPDFFVCNVGHIDNTHVAGLNDLQRTMNALRDIWMEFKKPDVKGLIANCVCVFPNVEGTPFSKEINLSAWASGEEAHDWYVKSPGHRRTMLEHSGGRLRTFGNLLASLKPRGKIRHQDRCTRCARLVESPELGERAPDWCGACGAPTFGYPWI